MKDWKEKKEVPIDIEIGNEFKFHSIFVDGVVSYIWLKFQMLQFMNFTLPHKLILIEI